MMSDPARNHPDHACPDCRDTAVVKFGTRARKQMVVDDVGTISRTSQVIQRYRCKACGHLFTQPPFDPETINEVSESIFQIGLAGAAAKSGLDKETVARTLKRWIEIREPELDRYIPDVLAISSLSAHLSKPLALTSPQEHGLLDIVDGLQGIKDYAANSTGLPSLVVIDVEPAIAAVVRGIWPNAIIAISPAMAARAIEVAALSSFRALVRDGVAKGRNYREAAKLLRIPDHELSDDERAELGNWSTPLRQFRFAVVLLLTDLKSADIAKFTDSFSRVHATVKNLTAHSALTIMLTTWKSAILAGVENRWIDTTCQAIDQLRREIHKLRPSSSFDTLRAILIFQTPAQRDPFGAHISFDLTEIAVKSRNIDRVVEILRSYSN